MTLKKIGKKGLAWRKEKAKRIKEDLASGIVEIVDGNIQGICKECKHWHPVILDHEIKQSLGGSHDRNNVGWICNVLPCNCHDKVDNMAGSKKTKDRKAKWMKPHKCRCGAIISSYICPYCERSFK